jgi:hypothetical protein
LRIFRPYRIAISPFLPQVDNLVGGIITKEIAIEFQREGSLTITV